MSDATISFPGLLADCECQIASAGFATELYTPQFGWSFPEDNEAAEDPFPAQLLAAYQIFIYFFVTRVKKAWVHLGAEMQAGKTGAVAALIRLILSNFRTLKIRPDHIFTITGMSDTAWKKQTKERLIGDVRNGVEHNSGLERIKAELYKIHSRCGGLRDMILIIDESHIASSYTNRPANIIINTMKDLCPRENWAENNIHILTISATDPSKVLDITNSSENDCAVVRLQTTPQYQSVETLNTSGRIIPINEDINSVWAIRRIRHLISTKYNNTPLYHILRPKAINYKRVIETLHSEFPDANVIPFDSASCSSSSSSGASSVASESDINDILEEAPEKTTFVILKNMFYAAKTLEDTHVGILFDRIGGKDDTNLQSLLGRACGYGKSDRTMIFTSKQTVENYISCWRELSSTKGFPAELKDIPVTEIKNKMPRIGVFRRNRETRVASTEPFMGAGATAPGSGMPPQAVRQKAIEDHYESEWREYSSFDQVKTWAPNVRPKKLNEGGFYLSSTTGATKVVRYDEVMGMKAGKKTANMPWGDLAVGGHVDRLYVAYKDLANPSSAVFVVRRLTRKE